MRTSKKILILIALIGIFNTNDFAAAQEKESFNTEWISSRPEVLTYKV